MRVLHIVTSLDPGGMENGVCNIARGLVAHGFETHVACLERRGKFANRLPESSGVSIVGKHSGFSISAILKLALILRRVRPHIVHTHNLGPLIYTSGATLGGRTCPILHGEHSKLIHWELEAKRQRQRRRVYKYCRAVHTVSQGQLDELLGLGFHHENFHCIPNGVDTKHFAPSNRNTSRIAFNIENDSLVLGLVGRFGSFKKHDLLLGAFEQIATVFPQTRLVFIGAGGSEEQRIHNLVSISPFRERIHLMGFHEDPAPLYGILDLLLIPSVNEGMSNAALEAMASGVPVLGNLGCGHEQIISKNINGILADLSTVSSTCAALTPLLSNPKALVTMGINARDYVESNFPLSKMLDAYVKLYRTHSRNI